MGCHRKVTASPLQGVVTGQKDKRKIHSHSHSLITTAQTLLGTPGEVQPNKLLAFRSSWGLVTPRTPNKTPLQDNNFQRSPTGGPDPPSYRVESVSLPTLYQSYYPISQTPPRIPIQAHLPGRL